MTKETQRFLTDLAKVCNAIRVKFVNEVKRDKKAQDIVTEIQTDLIKHGATKKIATNIIRLSLSKLGDEYDVEYLTKQEKKELIQTIIRDMIKRHGKTRS